MLRRLLFAVVFLGPWAFAQTASFCSPAMLIRPEKGSLAGRDPGDAGGLCESSSLWPCGTVRAPIDLTSLEVTPMDGTVVLQWETASESEGAAFALLRRETRTGNVERLNVRPISAEGSTVSGAVYTFVDGTAVNGVEYEYVLEALGGGIVDVHHAPSPVVPNPSAPPIRLISPSYGSRGGGAPVLTWESDRMVAATLEISNTAGFPAAETLWVPAGAESAKRLDRWTVSRLRSMASVGVGGVYWRVRGRADDGSIVQSRTYFLILEH